MANHPLSDCESRISSEISAPSTVTSESRCDRVILRVNFNGNSMRASGMMEGTSGLQGKSCRIRFSSRAANASETF